MEGGRERGQLGGCNAWKVAFADARVSVMVTIGIWRARTIALTRSTSGVTFWRL